MADLEESTKIDTNDNLSGGIQRKSSRFQQTAGEVNVAENVSFDPIGGFGKKLGYIQQNSDLTSTTTTSTSTSTTTTSTSTSTTTSTSTSTTTTA